MLSLNRVLKLRDLEVFRVLKDGNILSYVIIEDTRKPFTEEDKKIAPLCYMDEEDINAILNVFKISIVNDEKLNEDDSIFIRSYFSEFVNHTNLTNFIIKEYVQKDLYDYDDEDDIIFFNRILRSIGSDYVIKEFDDINWIYLSQD
ncbi:terpene synthase [Bacillus velezensis]|uniref:terpene synthase n=1 Tax=Bacillus velezensis TaxID=492670 RepID=UPI000BA5D733|nr:terpene synthase [Bacillus velezensis]NGM57735.1 terpene synthase [Bacillus velezensis]PAD04632.1 terpene synthase [Bacillus velezensis]USK15861.1 terpene synthase [Bacillus velezensis]USK19653.1 terpene synthase [Bacillus velezensis]UTY65323.1 terpene synthase [Bacillus velezensis]